jgi:two-component system, LuxR family, response regulator FixJ
LDEELASRLASLSQQESQVLKDLISGQANKEIVREFDLSPRTVEVYRAKLMTKNQAGSISVSVRFAINAGAFPS